MQPFSDALSALGLSESIAVTEVGRHLDERGVERLDALLGH